LIKLRIKSIEFKSPSQSHNYGPGSTRRKFETPEPLSRNPTELINMDIVNETNSNNKDE